MENGMSALRTLRLIKSDIRANHANYRCLLMITLYRLANYFSCLRKKSSLGAIVSVAPLVVYRILTEWVFQYEIPAATRIGQSLVIDHGYGIVINKNSVLGDFVRIRHRVTIGCKILPDGEQGPSPVLGSHVDVGAGATIIGGIRIGSNVKIGAGAVVVRDVPDGCVAVGNPARVIMPTNPVMSTKA